MPASPAHCPSRGPDLWVQPDSSSRRYSLGPWEALPNGVSDADGGRRAVCLTRDFYKAEEAGHRLVTSRASKPGLCSRLLPVRGSSCAPAASRLLLYRSRITAPAEAEPGGGRPCSREGVT